jgi:hypothetical protein
MSEKKIICFTGILDFCKTSLTKTKNNLYSVKIRISDSKYIIENNTIQIDHNYVWATIFADKNKNVCDILSSSTYKGMHILVKDCKISKFQSASNAEEKFGITTGTNQIVLSSKPLPLINTAIVMSKMSHSLNGKPFMIDNKPSFVMTGESFDIPVVYDNDGFRPQEGYTLLIGKISGKTTSQTQIPHIVSQKITPC